MNTINESSSEMYDLREQHKKDTLGWYFAKLFEENPNIPLSAGEIDSRASLMFLEHRLKERNINTFTSSNVTDIMKELHLLMRNIPAIKLPGDAQRRRRSFYNDGTTKSLAHKHHGIRQDGKIYTYTPMRKSEINDAICDRRCFRREFRDHFIQKMGHKCEMCGNSYEDERLCIDHGRSFDNYGITDEKLAVLLCIKCNNIKKNGSAIQIVVKDLENIEKLFRNFLIIEKRLIKNGFPPSEEEKTKVDNIIRTKIIPTFNELGRDTNNIQTHYFDKYYYDYQII